MADEAAQDEAGLVVKERFIQFINGYQPPADHVDNDDAQRSAGMFCDSHLCTSIITDENSILPLCSSSLENGDAYEQISSLNQRLLYNYKEQLTFMMQHNKSTLYVDFTHVKDTDFDLAEAIEMEYYRFEPFLRKAIQEIISIDNQHYVYDVDKGSTLILAPVIAPSLTHFISRRKTFFCCVLQHVHMPSYSKRDADW